MKAPVDFVGEGINNRSLGGNRLQMVPAGVGFGELYRKWFEKRAFFKHFEVGNAQVRLVVAAYAGKAADIYGLAGFGLRQLPVAEELHAPVVFVGKDDFVCLRQVRGADDHPGQIERYFLRFCRFKKAVELFDGTKSVLLCPDQGRKGEREKEETFNFHFTFQSFYQISGCFDSIRSYNFCRILPYY